MINVFDPRKLIVKINDKRINRFAENYDLSYSEPHGWIKFTALADDNVTLDLTVGESYGVLVEYDGDGFNKLNASFNTVLQDAIIKCEKEYPTITYLFYQQGE